MSVFKKMITYTEAGNDLKEMGGILLYISEGNFLRVLKLVDEDYGCDCGGTHVKILKDIAKVTITKIQKRAKTLGYHTMLR